MDRGQEQIQPIRRNNLLDSGIRAPSSRIPAITA
jgi:hypothetical protein